MKKVILLLTAALIFAKSYSQNTVAVPTNAAGVTISPNDNFSYLGYIVPHYGIGWYGTNEPPKMFQTGYNGIRFFTEGSPKLDLSFAGDLGLGVVNPSSRLHIAGGNESILIGNYENNNTTKGIYFTGYRDVQPNYFGASIEAVPEWACCGGYPGSGYAGVKNVGLDFNIHGNQDVASSKFTALSIKSSGYIGIGTTTPNEKLTVNGKIRAKEIKVESDPATWPDYVFNKDYKPKTLPELEKYIQTNKHLPEVPTAKDVAANGIELGEMNRLLLKKVEELTLYLIEKDKSLKITEEKLIQQEKTSQTVMDLIQQLQNQLTELKSKLK